MTEFKSLKADNDENIEIGRGSEKYRRKSDYKVLDEVQTNKIRGFKIVMICFWIRAP